MWSDWHPVNGKDCVFDCSIHSVPACAKKKKKLVQAQRMVSHLGNPRVNLLALESKLLLDNICRHFFSSGEGNVHNLNFKCNALVGKHLYKAHVVILRSYSNLVEFCELLHLLSKSDLHCFVSYEMFLIYNPQAAMESSSVYMCFPCYQEFNTLEEVLKHQLTCTAEDEQTDTSGTIPITVPALQTQVNTGTLSNLSFLSCDCAWVF